jgi:argininosuccinate synthase
MKIVLAYSGGLDTSVILTLLREPYSAEIIAFCADIGQEEERCLTEKALRTGASNALSKICGKNSRAIYLSDVSGRRDLRRAMLLGTSIARPLIAKRMVEIARAESADAVAHGATGRGMIRFGSADVAALGRLVIAPWREKNSENNFPGAPR